MAGDPSTVDTEPTDRDNDGTGPRGRHHDRMSPPPGYPAHRKGRHFTYAMGYFGLAADGTALAEVREIWSAGSYSVQNFRRQAVEFATQRIEGIAARQARLAPTAQNAVQQRCQGRRSSRPTASPSGPR